MAAYYNQKTKKWDANFSYRDFENNSKKKMKRGFETKEDALAWEQSYKELCKKDMSKSFGEFYKNYESDIRPRVKASTWRSKEYVVKYKILPYFKDMPMSSIKPLDVLKWQNELLKMRNKEGKGLSGTYLKTIQSQLSAIFNHAVRYYALTSNPVKMAGPIGTVRAKEVHYWTKKEYIKFIECMKENDKYYKHLQRTAAEFDNYKKRVSKEKDAIYNLAVGDTVAKYVNVLDNIDRALAIETTDDKMKEGISLIKKQMLDIMTSLGCAEIPTVGETFNPEIHDAVMHIESEDYGEQQIVEELRKGYKCGDRVIRHAMVKVAN